MPSRGLRFFPVMTQHVPKQFHGLKLFCTAHRPYFCNAHGYLIATQRHFLKLYIIPEKVTKTPESYTGKYLAELLGN